MLAALTIQMLECSKILRIVELYSCAKRVGFGFKDKLAIALSKFSRPYDLLAILEIWVSHDNLLSNTTPR